MDIIAIEREKKKLLSHESQLFFKRQQDLLEALLAANKHVDVAFLCDCTGSMFLYINETKNKIRKIITATTNSYANITRMAFVGYRDHSDGDKRIECLCFTENIEEFETFLNSIEASGGDDTPEDVLGVIC